ncbi:MAG: DUF2330 domain-containing protein, partial [Cyanobacteria bacterium P01_E01_bin.34]
MKLLKQLLTATITIAILLSCGSAARAFCGFYVGKADAALFNEASQVILARDGDRTVITMANDYRGDLDEFAMVVPVPTVLEEGQINVGDYSIIDRFDAFTAPRLVEYFDPDPCAPRWDYRERALLESADAPLPQAVNPSADSELGVTVEAEYSLGEYDIQILKSCRLSIRQSQALGHALCITMAARRQGGKPPHTLRRNQQLRLQFDKAREHVIAVRGKQCGSDNARQNPGP